MGVKKKLHGLKAIAAAAGKTIKLHCCHLLSCSRKRNTHNDAQIPKQKLEIEQQLGLIKRPAASWSWDQQYHAVFAVCRHHSPKHHSNIRLKSKWLQVLYRTE